MRRFGKRIEQAVLGLGAGVGLCITACTSAKENSEFNATVPTTINSDADRRAIYNNATISTAPSSIPRNLNDQASEINRQKNIENRGSERSSNRPLEVRTEEIGRPTTDTLRQAIR